jgi:hypothetical protein
VNIRQALAVLRRTGFIALVVASSAAKAPAALAFEPGQGIGKVDASLHLLERVVSLSNLAASAAPGADQPALAGSAIKPSPVWCGGGEKRDRAFARPQDMLRALRLATCRARPARCSHRAHRRTRSASPRRHAQRAAGSVKRAVRKRRRAESYPGGFDSAVGRTRALAGRWRGTREGDSA